MSNILALPKLHPVILEHIEGLPVGTPNGHLTERLLRPVARLGHAEKRPSGPAGEIRRRAGRD